MEIKRSGSKRSFNLTRRELLKLSAATGGALVRFRPRYTAFSWTGNFSKYWRHGHKLALPTSAPWSHVGRVGGSKPLQRPVLATLSHELRAPLNVIRGLVANAPGGKTGQGDDGSCPRDYRAQYGCTDKAGQ